MNETSSLTQSLDKHLGPSWEMTCLKGDSGERSYSRVHNPNQSYILAQYPEDRRGFVGFVQQQIRLKNQGFNVPQIYESNKQEGYQIIQDIGSLSLEKFYLQEKTLKYYKDAIECIHALQKMSHGEEHSFTKEQSLREIKNTFDEFNLQISEQEQEDLFTEWDDLSQKLIQSPFKIAHRDFHSRNLFIYQNSLYLIDFQDMGLYPAYYDLVSLIEDSYVSFSKEDRQSLLRLYAKKTGEDINPSLYNLIFFQRGFKAVGNFLNFRTRRGQTTHLKYIKPTLNQVKSYLEIEKNYPCFLNYINRILIEK